MRRLELMLRPLAVVLMMLTVGLILAVPQVGASPAVGGDGVLGDIRFSYDADTNLVSASAGTLASAVTDGAASAGRHRSLVAPPANSIGDVYDAGRSLLAPNGLLDDAAFAQTTFRETFSNGGRFAGQTIDDVAGGLRSGALSPGDVPIEFIVRDGNSLILNTRSAQALTRAGVPRSQWLTTNVTGNAAAEARLTAQLSRNGLDSAGTLGPISSGG